MNGALKECGSGGRAGSMRATVRVARRARHVGRADDGRLGLGALPRCSRSSLPRGRDSLRHDAGRGRGGAGAAAQQPRRGEPARGDPRRRAGPAQRLERRFRRLLETPACRCRRPTGPRAGGGSTAAGPSIASPSSSTATAFTAHATRGSATAAASARRERAATTSAASPSAMSTTLAPCWPSFLRRCLAGGWRISTAAVAATGVACWRARRAGGRHDARAVGGRADRPHRARAVRRRRRGDRERGRPVRPQPRVLHLRSAASGGRGRQAVLLRAPRAAAEAARRPSASTA